MTSGVTFGTLERFPVLRDSNSVGIEVLGKPVGLLRGQHTVPGTF